MTDSVRIRTQMEHALAYIQRGWHLAFFDDGVKSPRTNDWNTRERLASQPGHVIDALKRGPQNMGLCHSFSGTMALDVDHLEHTRTIFSELGLDLDKIVDQGLRIKSRVGRDKAIFALPKDMGGRKAINWPAEKPTKPNETTTIFELRTGGTQDVLPPSRHPDGHFYEWFPGRAPWDFEEIPVIPPELLALWESINDRSSGILDEIQALCPWRKTPMVKQYVVRARNTTRDHQDVIGKFNAANNIGDLLEGNGYKRKGRRYLAPSSSTVIPGVVVLEDRCYSHHGSDVLADGYAHDAFDLHCIFNHNGDIGAAITSAAEELGIDRDRPVPTMEIDLAAVMEAQRKRREQHAPPAVVAIQESEPLVVLKDAKRAPVPPHLLTPPGVLGEIVRYTLQTSQQPQPELAVAAAISTVATVLAQRVMGHTRARTNFYILGIADSGTGKDHARKVAKRVLESGGLESRIGGEDLGSGPGVLAAASRCPATLFLLDEFGDVMRTIGGKNAASHERSVMTVLTKLFSSTDGTYRGTEYANQKDRSRSDIPFPCINFYATTVPSSFYPSLSSENISSGWLNRMIIVTAAPGRPARQEDAALTPPPDSIVSWVKAASAMSGSLEAGAEPIGVPMNGMGKALMNQFRDWVERHEDALKADPGRAPLAELWKRAVEQALKLALVVAVGKVPADQLPRNQAESSLEVDVTSVQWAVDYIRHYLSETEREVNERVGDSEMDQIANALTQIIARHGERGATVRELNNLCRPFKAIADKKRQYALLETIQFRGDAFLQKQVSANNKVREAWVARQYVPDAETGVDGP